MREQLNDNALDTVVGGVVRLSGERMRIAFTTRKEAFNLQNCTYTQALVTVSTLYEENKHIGDAAFDNLVYNTFRDNGWI